MAAKHTHTSEGIKLRRTIGGWAGTIGNSNWTFRKKDGSWIPKSQQHRTKPLSDFSTLADAVLWAKAHVERCLISCTEEYHPFQNLRAPTSRPMVGTG